MNRTPWTRELTKQLLLSSTITTATNTDSSGASLDTRGWGWMIFEMTVHGWTTPQTVTMQVLDSADNSTFAANATYTSAAIGVAGDITAGAQTKQMVIYLPSTNIKRYVRVRVISTAGTGSIQVSVVGRLMAPKEMQQTAAGSTPVFSTQLPNASFVA